MSGEPHSACGEGGSRRGDSSVNPGRVLLGEGAAWLLARSQRKVWVVLLVDL